MIARIHVHGGHIKENRKLPAKKRTLEEIRRTPVGLLTETEISQCDPDFQEFARRYKDRVVREAACPGHERIETATREQANRGDHKGQCKHCGKNMSYDSGD